MSKERLPAILALGGDYEKARVLVGYGRPAQEIVLKAFEANVVNANKADGGGDKMGQRPPLEKKLVQAVIAYVDALKEEGGTAKEKLKLESWKIIVEDFAFRWGERAQAAVKEEDAGIGEPRISNAERNSMIAKEVIAERRLRKRGGSVEVFKSVGGVDSDNVTRAGEDKFLSDLGMPPKDISARLATAKRALAIGDRRLGIGDNGGAATGYRFGLNHLNFDNQRDIVWYLDSVTAMEKELLKPTRFALHLGLAKALLEMAGVCLKLSERLVLSTEASSQANGAVELDPGNSKAIVVRGKARMESQDFEAARLDFVEAIRVGGEDERREYEVLLEDLSGTKKKVEGKEKELWSDEVIRKEMIDGGYTFLGQEVGIGLKGWARRVLQKNPAAIVGLGVGILMALIAVLQKWGWMGREVHVGGVNKMRELEKEARRIVMESRPTRKMDGGADEL